MLSARFSIEILEIILNYFIDLNVHLHLNLTNKTIAISKTEVAVNFMVLFFLHAFIWRDILSRALFQAHEPII